MQRKSLWSTGEHSLCLSKGNVFDFTYTAAQTRDFQSFSNGSNAFLWTSDELEDLIKALSKNYFFKRDFKLEKQFFLPIYTYILSYSNPLAKRPETGTERPNLRIGESFLEQIIRLDDTSLLCQLVEWSSPLFTSDEKSFYYSKHGPYRFTLSELVSMLELSRKHRRYMYERFLEKASLETIRCKKELNFSSIFIYDDFAAFEYRIRFGANRDSDSELRVKEPDVPEHHD